MAALIPTFFPVVMALLDKTWQASIITVRYFLLFLLALGLYNLSSKRDSFSIDLFNFLDYSLNSLVVNIGSNLVYWVFLAGLISIGFGFPVIYLVPVVLVGSFGQFFTFEQMPEFSEQEELAPKNYFSGLIYLLVLLLIGISFILQGSLYTNLVGLFFYGLLFWKI